MLSEKNRVLPYDAVTPELTTTIGARHDCRLTPFHRCSWSGYRNRSVLI